MASYSKMTTSSSAAMRSAWGLAAVRQTILAWIGRSRARRDLARLDPHLLADIGLDEVDVRRECARSFWED
jgi:uncharacterized protein YjiS (DUF1127 family)